MSVYANDPGIFHAVFLIYFVAVLTAVALGDLRTRTIKNTTVFLLVPLAIASFSLYPEISPLSRAIGFFAASLPMLIMTVISTGAFGGGDIKLMAAIGIILGWKLVLLAFVFACVLGTAAAAVQIIRKKASLKDTIAFGPALCIGSLAAFVAGGWLLEWLWLVF